MCVRCRNANCSLVRCRNSQLTIKGYRQGHDLGGFIKTEYYPKFYQKNISYIEKQRRHPNYKDSPGQGFFFSENGTPLKIESDPPKNSYTKNETRGEDGKISADIKIHGYYYKSSKNRIFLKSITDVLEYAKLDVSPITELGCKKECLDLRNSLFFKEDSKRLKTESDFDRLVGSLCNEVPIECSKFNCDLMKMEEYMTQERMTFEDNIARMREDIVSTAISFGALSQFILDLIKKPDMSIVSVTGETILTLLSGLNTQNTELVPYAGAVFIELWIDQNGKEFFSVRYNGRRMSFGLYKEQYVEKEQFLKFLKMYAKHEKSVSQICKLNTRSMSREDLLGFKREKLMSEFDPLIRRLHERRILMK